MDSAILPGSPSGDSRQTRAINAMAENATAIFRNSKSDPGTALGETHRFLVERFGGQPWHLSPPH